MPSQNHFGTLEHEARGIIWNLTLLGLVQGESDTLSTPFIPTLSFHSHSSELHIPSVTASSFKISALFIYIFIVLFCGVLG